MDSEDIANLVNRLNLKPEKEKDCFVLPAGLAHLGQARLELSLVAKVFSPKLVNRDTFRTHMPKILQVSKQVDVEMVGENVFVLDFHSATDRRRALLGGPWNFFKDLVIFREPQGFQQPSELSFSDYSIWVQLHNLPLAFMHPEILRSIGGQIGKVCDVGTDDAGRCTGRFARVRVSRSIDQPLLQGIWVQPEDACNTICVPLLYERLPNFCFSCGRLGHLMKDCEDSEVNTGSPAFGAWLRAPGSSSTKKSSSQRKEETSDQNSTSQATSKLCPKGIYISGNEDTDSPSSGPTLAQGKHWLDQLERPMQLIEFPVSSEGRVASSLDPNVSNLIPTTDIGVLEFDENPMPSPDTHLRKLGWKRLARDKGKRTKS